MGVNAIVARSTTALKTRSIPSTQNMKQKNWLRDVACDQHREGK